MQQSGTQAQSLSCAEGDRDRFGNDCITLRHSLIYALHSRILGMIFRLFFVKSDDCSCKTTILRYQFEHGKIDTPVYECFKKPLCDTGALVGTRVLRPSRSLSRRLCVPTSNATCSRVVVTYCSRWLAEPNRLSIFAKGEEKGTGTHTHQNFKRSA